MIVNVNDAIFRLCNNLVYIPVHYLFAGVNFTSVLTSFGGPTEIQQRFNRDSIEVEDSLYTECC